MGLGRVSLGSGERDTVLRATRVVIKYRDQDSWQIVRDTVSGFTAVIFSTRSIT